MLPDKAQWVRVLDVILFGPLLLAYAAQHRPLSDLQRLTLAIIGGGTLLYNLHYYRLNLPNHKDTHAAPSQ